MTYFSNEIKDFLDKIYFYELSHWDGSGNVAPIHKFFEDRLKSVDLLPHHSLSTRFPFNRDKLFVLTIGRFIFGYRFDGINAVVELYIKTKSMGDWIDTVIPESKQAKRTILLTESQLRNIIRRTILESLYN